MGFGFSKLYHLSSFCDLDVLRTIAVCEANGGKPQRRQAIYAQHLCCYIQAAPRITTNRPQKSSKKLLSEVFEIAGNLLKIQAA